MYTEILDDTVTGVNDESTHAPTGYTKSQLNIEDGDNNEYMTINDRNTYPR